MPSPLTLPILAITVMAAGVTAHLTRKPSKSARRSHRSKELPPPNRPTQPTCGGGHSRHPCRV